MVTSIAVGGCIILLQVQAINFIMSNAIFLRTQFILYCADDDDGTIENLDGSRYQVKTRINTWREIGRASCRERV